MSTNASTPPPLPTLSKATTLPHRSRQSLEHLLQDARREFEQHLPKLLQDAEIALAGMPVGNDPKLEAARQFSMRSMSLGVKLFQQRFMAKVEASLAELQAPRRSQLSSGNFSGLPLSLLDDEEESDKTLLETLASRIEARNSLPLQLLGQRIGVLARAPAFEGDDLPLGPYDLCRALSDATDALELSRYARLQLFQQFEKLMLEHYPALLERLNTRLIQNDILPHLSFVPVRPRGTGNAPQPDESAAATQPAPASAPSPASSAPPVVPGLDQVSAIATARHGKQTTDAGFAGLQQLLKKRRQLLSKLRRDPKDDRVRATLQREDVLQGLQHLRNSATKADNFAEYRQILLAQARQKHGHGVALDDPDNDAFDLLGMVFGQLQRELRKSSPGDTMLGHLHVPLMQLGLHDSKFFTDDGHPARQLLDAISLAGAHWLSEDDLDTQWLGLLRRAVIAVQQDTQGVPATFEEANQALQSGLAALARKTEMAERRQIEAARGREKLEVAKQRAQLEIARRTEGRTLPEFHRILLEQAWVDVLSLAHLRTGDQSGAWHQLLEVTTHIIDSSIPEAPLPLNIDDLQTVRNALEQVGYHADGANAITQQLARPCEDNATASELLLQHDTRARLGENQAGHDAPAATPLSAEEIQARERLRCLDGPTWIELETAQGSKLRRRLAWVSTETGQALMVNRRGQRAGEEDLDTLARMLAAGRLRLLADDQAPAEAAWATIIDSLQRMVSGDQAEDQETPDEP